MTDSFDVAGDFSPAQNFSNDDSSNDSSNFDAGDKFVQSADAVEATVEPVAEVPNGFLALGLAPELIAAVKDLGFTQPTTVQLKTIPLAMQTEAISGKAARFIDLMVSSQTGSGKTAAFLLPVLHTLLMQDAQAEAQERAEFEQAVADAAAKGEAPPKRASAKTLPTHATSKRLSPVR